LLNWKRREKASEDPRLFLFAKHPAMGKYQAKFK
jgi:hypothetical protein